MESRDDANPIFNPADFTSIELKITFMNLTTNMKIKDGVKSSGVRANSKEEIFENETGADLTIKLVEFADPPGVILEIPSRTCAEGHQVQILIDATGIKDIYNQFDFRGRVVQSEKLGQQRESISVQFEELNIDAWNSFINIYQARQNEIFEYFASVKP